MYRNLNMSLLKKYKNPLKILYLWTIQEVLEIQAITEAIKSIGEIDENRKKMMKKIKMTQDELDMMKPTNTGNARELFGQDDSVTSERSRRLNLDSTRTFEAQKDVVLMVSVYEMAIYFMVDKIIPRFKAERVDTYRKILNQFSKMEQANSSNIILMWQSIIEFHKAKATEILVDEQSLDNEV